LTKEDIYYSSLIPLIECIRNGTTTIIDHHESQSCQKGSLEEIAKAVKEALPDLSDKYVDHFVDLAEDLSIKKFNKKGLKNKRIFLSGILCCCPSHCVDKI
jgi:hypothetical protein